MIPFLLRPIIAAIVPPTTSIREDDTPLFDYHVHSEFSVDCNVPMDASCASAIEAGITEIAFTDHVDFQPDDPGYGYYRPDAYFASLEQVRRRYDGKIRILAGAEVDFHIETMPEVEAFIREYGSAYDFVLGSVHYAANGALIYPEYFRDRASDTIFLDYFEQVRLAVETEWFDTIGHMDIPKRYLPRDRRTYDPLVYREALDKVFATMIDHNVGFEINTSGIRQAPKTSMPGPVLVRWYVEAGGTRITTGTDSHQAKTVGSGIRETLAMLKLCGIGSVLSFRQRAGTPVPIDHLME